MSSILIHSGYLRNILPRALAAVLLVVVTYVVCMADAYAAGVPAGVCTTDPTFNIPNSMTIISNIVDNITCILYGAAGNPRCTAGGSVASIMFTQIVTDTTFITVIRATLSLFVIIYGIAFSLGMVQFTLMEFLVRVMKMGVVIALLTPTAWNFFYNIVGVFFQNGTNWLIAISTQIAMGSIPGLDTTRPFLLIDQAIATAFSAKMFVTMVTMFFTGPYGWLFGILILMGLGSFVAAIFQAVWIYLMSMVIRAFLFGLAPIFIPFLLFSKTKHLFDGWVNQLMNSMLQPVLLFTFFAFFSVLVKSAMNNILRVPVCYMPGEGYFSGSPNDEVLPRFTINGSPYGGTYGFTGPVDFPGFGAFPIDIMDVLIFLLLTQLAWRFNGISINIAKELSGAALNLNVPGAFTNMLSPTRAATNRVMYDSDRALGGIGMKEMDRLRSQVGGGNDQALVGGAGGGGGAGAAGGAMGAAVAQVVNKRPKGSTENS